MTEDRAVVGGGGGQEEECSVVRKKGGPAETGVKGRRSNKRQSVY